MSRLIFSNIKCRVRFAVELYVTLASVGLAQSLDTAFVTRAGSNLTLNNYPFYAIGVNCYYLQNLAAYGDTAHLDEVFQEVSQLGVNTIRTWGFFDSPDSMNAAVIQKSLGEYNESGLRALDLVIAKAKEKSIRLIIPLVNNWEDYGGMNQYVRWYAQQFPDQNFLTKANKQKIITGCEGRLYHYFVSNQLTHDDFYTNQVIKQWYKNYLSMLVDRINTVTGIQYKDESTILAWEMANEPRSSDRSGAIVYNWLNEMSTFIKSIDQNHLVSSGEEGLDVSSISYNTTQLYDDRTWLFDGTGGISFKQNIQIENIDIGSIHCYPDHWGLTGTKSLQWINDHNRISNQFQKPLIIGEVGKLVKPELYYEALFNTALYSTTAGVLLWQFTYDARLNNDGYAFSYPKDSFTCNIFRTYSELFIKKSNNNLPVPAFFKLLPNYPNPFNTATIIPYTLNQSSYVNLDIYNVAGQLITRLFEGHQVSGCHVLLFDGFKLSSGTYFTRITIGNNISSRKIILLK